MACIMCICYQKTDAHIYLVMAYCSAGDLSQYIRKRGQVSGLVPPSSSSSPSSTASPHPSSSGATRGRRADLPTRAEERFPHPRDGGLNEMVVRSFLGQLAEALKFLRNQNIIHRDIKPQVMSQVPLNYDTINLEISLLILLSWLSLSLESSVTSCGASRSSRWTSRRNSSPASGRFWLRSCPSATIAGRNTLWFAALHGA